MAKILSGKEVAQQVKDRSRLAVQQLQTQNIVPCLSIVRVGERPDDLYYQGGLEKVCADVGVACHITALPQDVSQQELEAALTSFSNNQAIHGILLFNPLPKHLDATAAKEKIAHPKDVDCLTTAAAADVFTDEPNSFAPCTAAAVMELLNYYNITLEGKRVTIVGRSLVVGKPLAMLMMKQNATVTICHSRTKNLPKVCQEAEILVAAIGRAMMFTKNYVQKEQIVIDVGINPHPQKEGRICGDLDYEEVEPMVNAVTPVPGGIGSITSAILIWHTIQACQRMSKTND